MATWCLWGHFACDACEHPHPEWNFACCACGHRGMTRREGESPKFDDRVEGQCPRCRAVTSHVMLVDTKSQCCECGHVHGQPKPRTQPGQLEMFTGRPA
jgi:hypothetical protein